MQADPYIISYIIIHTKNQLVAEKQLVILNKHLYTSKTTRMIKEVKHKPYIVARSYNRTYIYAAHDKNLTE